MAFLAVEALFFGLAAEVGIRIGRVKVPIVVVVISVFVLLLQAEEVHLGGHMGGVNEVQAVRHQPLSPGLLHHLVEQALEALGSQTLPEAAQGGVIGGQLLGAQAQEAFEHHVPGGLLFQLSVREVVEELQEDHFEHQHRVPGVSAPVDVEVFQGLFDKGKVHRSGQIVEEMGTPAQQLVVDEVALKEPWVLPDLLMRPPGKNKFPILQHVRPFGQRNLAYF